MGVDLQPLIETESETADPICAHYVERQPDDPRTPQAIIMEARVNGTALTALCGFVWVPSRDPQKLPLCQKCEELFGFALQMRGHDPDTKLKKTS